MKNPLESVHIERFFSLIKIQITFIAFLFVFNSRILFDFKRFSFLSVLRLAALNDARLCNDTSEIGAVSRFNESPRLKIIFCAACFWDADGVKKVFQFTFRSLYRSQPQMERNFAEQ